MIVLPGGGYSSLSAHEGQPVADWLRSIGLAAIVHEYPVGAENRHPAALDSLRGLISQARGGLPGLHHDQSRIGVVGFSAGAHLGALSALAEGRAGGRPDLVVLGYPVVTMMSPTGGGSRATLLGHEPSEELAASVSLERLVTAASPPMFIWHTAHDASVPVWHSYSMGTALAAKQVRHEVHVFRSGVHGLGLAESAGTASGWTHLCELWLRAEGWIG